MATFNIWMNGRLVPQEQAVLPVNSAAVFYATNVFEGLRAYWNEARRGAVLLPPRRALRAPARVDEDDALHACPTATTTSSRRCASVLAGNELREDIHMHMVAYVARAGPRRHHADRALHQPAHAGRAVTEGNGLKLQCVSSWMRTSDNAIPIRLKSRLQLPERPAGDAAVQGRRLRPADLPEPPGHGGRGHAAPRFFMVRKGRS